MIVPVIFMPCGKSDTKSSETKRSSSIPTESVSPFIRKGRVAKRPAFDVPPASKRASPVISSVDTDHRDGACSVQREGPASAVSVVRVPCHRFFARSALPLIVAASAASPSASFALKVS